MNISIPRLVNTASVALLMYDYLCTLDREVRSHFSIRTRLLTVPILCLQVTSVWTCPISLGIPLFYINRYIPFVDQTLLMLCAFLLQNPLS